MNPLFHTEFSISDSLKNVRKSVLIYETIIHVPRFLSEIPVKTDPLPDIFHVFPFQLQHTLVHKNPC